MAAFPSRRQRVDHEMPPRIRLRIAFPFRKQLSLNPQTSSFTKSANGLPRDWI